MKRANFLFIIISFTVGTFFGGIITYYFPLVINLLKHTNNTIDTYPLIGKFIGWISTVIIASIGLQLTGKGIKNWGIERIKELYNETDTCLQAFYTAPDESKKKTALIKLLNQFEIVSNLLLNKYLDSDIAIELFYPLMESLLKNSKVKGFILKTVKEDIFSYHNLLELYKIWQKKHAKIILKDKLESNIKNYKEPK